jgi:hypothetical protein
MKKKQYSPLFVTVLLCPKQIRRLIIFVKRLVYHFFQEKAYRLILPLIPVSSHEKLPLYSGSNFNVVHCQFNFVFSVNF